MPAPKGHPRYGGRAKGTPNKISSTVKDNVVEVFNRIGGVDKMAEWAQNNQTEFFKIYSRLLPTDVDASVSGKLTVTWEQSSES